MAAIPNPAAMLTAGAARLDALLGREHESGALPPRARAGLLGLVIVTHGALAWWLATLAPHADDVPAAGAISVSWIEPAPQPQAPPQPETRPPEPQRRPEPVPPQRPQPRVQQPQPVVPIVSTPATAEPAQAPVVAAPEPPAPAAPSTAPQAPVAAAQVAAPPLPAEPRLVSTSSVNCYERPQPNYPLVSQRGGEQGSGLVRLYLDPQGRPSKVELLRSTNYPRLDQAGVKAMWGYRCKPYLENGVAVPIMVDQPFSFGLDQ